MEAPVIVIGGKERKAMRPKARFWRELVEFDEGISGIEPTELMERTAGIVASAYDGVDADDVLDSLCIDELRKAYAERCREAGCRERGSAKAH